MLVTFWGLVAILRFGEVPDTEVSGVYYILLNGDEGDYWSLTG